GVGDDPIRSSLQFVPGTLDSAPRSSRILKSLVFLSRMFRRKPRDETNSPPTKPFSACRADVRKRWLINTLAQGNAARLRRYGEPVMQNVVAINAEASQGIIAAQATSDDML